MNFGGRLGGHALACLAVLALQGASCASADKAIMSRVPASAAEPTPEDPDGIDWDNPFIVSEEVDVVFWCHINLGIVPRFTATQLFDARMPLGIDRIVAFNRGALFGDEEFMAEGLPFHLADQFGTMSIVDTNTDSMVLLSKDDRILAWLPIHFDSNAATGNVLVVECD